MKPIKYILFVTVLGLLVCGCGSSWCLRKYPPLITVDTVVKDTTIYRDTIIYKTLLGDTVVTYDTIVESPAGVIYASVYAKTELSYAKAWIENRKLKLKLVQKDSLIAFKIDSAFQSNKHVEYITRTEIHEKEIKPKFYRFFMWGFFSLALVIILLIALRKMFK